MPYFSIYGISHCLIVPQKTLSATILDDRECKYSLKSGPVSHSKMGHPRERTKLIK